MLELLLKVSYKIRVCAFNNGQFSQEKHILSVLDLEDATPLMKIELCRKVTLYGIREKEFT